MTPAAEHRFTCSACGETAGTIKLTKAEVFRDSFTSQLTSRVAEDLFEPLRKAIVSGDARALWSLDFELAPFYCPECDASFCVAHWTRWNVFDEDGWHDSIRGACPAGHSRMLED